jgi:hypothetical protein
LAQEVAQARHDLRYEWIGKKGWRAVYYKHSNRELMRQP